MGSNGEVVTRPLDLGLADGQEEVALEDLVVDVKGHSVHQLILKEHDRVGIPDGSLAKGQNKAMGTMTEDQLVNRVQPNKSLSLSLLR